MSALRRSVPKAHKIDKHNDRKKSSDELYSLDLTLSSPTMLGNTKRDSKMNRHDSSRSPVTLRPDVQKVGKQVGIIVKDQYHLKKRYGDNV